MELKHAPSEFHVVDLILGIMGIIAIILEA